MGIIERYGSGIKRIKGECDKNGNPYPEWSALFGEFATTYRPRVDNNASLGVQISTPETTPENSATTPETSTDRILRKIKKSPTITVSELSNRTGLSIDGVKWNLRKLKSLGIIRGVGYTKGGHWEVTDAATDAIVTDS